MKNKNYIRINEGIKLMFSKKVYLFIPITYTLILGYLVYKGECFFNGVDNLFYSGWYMNIISVFAVVIWFLGVLIIFMVIGTPIESRRIERLLEGIDFTDKDGNTPIIVAMTKEQKGIKIVFYSSKISLLKYQNHIADIETALNIKIISIEYGRDRQHVIIKAINSGLQDNEMILWNDKYLSSNDFEIALGESFGGRESIDICTTPHVLIGGGSGSGKSKLLKSVLMQSIKKGAIVILADFKGGLDYPEIWHEKCELITEKEKLAERLLEILEIMEERKWLLINAGVPNIAEYNEKTATDMKRIIIACDEIAEVLDKTGLNKDEKAIVLQIESRFSTIARLGRAFGVHLIFSTQRPDADILKGQIKNNIGYRICGRADKVLSQIILDNSDAADKILPDDQGMFLMNTGVLFKAYYVEDNCWQ